MWSLFLKQQYHKHVIFLLVPVLTKSEMGMEYTTTIIAGFL